LVETSPSRDYPMLYEASVFFVVGREYLQWIV
jgi:hypothetical protein